MAATSLLALAMDDEEAYLRDMVAISELLDQARSYSFAELQSDDDPAPPPAIVVGEAPGSATGLLMKTVEAPGDGGECPICLDGGGGGDAWRETACGHQFHARCVERWAKVKGSCPMCRQGMMSPAELLGRDLQALYDEEELQFMATSDGWDMLEWL